MDVLQILEESARRLPAGDYSAGLNAIQRHLDAAIRHFNRDQQNDPDCFTDSIYRTNQAYEGSLKEAYRVLAEKDPSGKTPNDIEKYLENNSILRPRILTQLSRYRQDYRNPSTHDYKLDFDEGESLLAIVSVAAFAKLLIDQIAEKIAFNEASGKEPLSKLNLSGSQDHITREIANFICRYCNEDDFINKRDIEFEGSLSGALSRSGVSVDTTSSTDNAWDILVKHKDNLIAIETRRGDNRFGNARMLPIYYLIDGMKEENLTGGIIISRLRQGGNYIVVKAEDEDNSCYIITKWNLEKIQDRLGPSWKVKIPE